METGDPKQVAVLAVVAVVALGFVFTRLPGKGLPTPPIAASAKPPAVVSRAGEPPLLRDPFSHPRLAPPKPKPTAVPETGSVRLAKAPDSLIGTLPPLGPLTGVASAPITVEATKPASKPPKPPAPSTTIIGLEAVAGAGDAVAFLAVGDAESQPFHASERVLGTIRLVRVDDGRVVLSGPKGHVILAVGEKVSL